MTVGGRSRGCAGGMLVGWSRGEGANYKLLSVPPVFRITSPRMTVSPSSRWIDPFPSASFHELSSRSSPPLLHCRRWSFVSFLSFLSLLRTTRIRTRIPVRFFSSLSVRSREMVDSPIEVDLAPKLDTLGEIHGRDAGRRGGKTKGDERRHRETHKIHSAHLIILCFWSIPRRVPLSQSPSAGIVPFAHTPLRRVTRIRTVYGFSKPDRLSTIHTCTPASGTRARSRRPRL